MHVPVLLKETLELLQPKKGESYLDLTTGYGGHSSAMIEVTKAPEKSVLVDRDQFAIDHITELYKGQKVEIVKQNFAIAAQNLLEEGRQFDLILADLGVSSPHLNTASRGFSFMSDGPLDMRMDQSSSTTAADIVNNESAEVICKILTDYGEERRAKHVANIIVQNRPFTTTQELARTLESALGWRTKGHHPATRTFQALRIAVNDELGLLQTMLPIALQLLKPDGRFGVISFQSLEDRIVKHTFNEATAGGYDAIYRQLTKKPIQPARTEIVNNPRSRSAKLRGVAKINIRKDRLGS